MQTRERKIQDAEVLARACAQLKEGYGMPMSVIEEAAGARRKIRTTGGAEAAIASPSLLGRIRRLRIEDLARWPLLARERGSGTQAAVAGALAKRGARIPPAFELPSPEALIHAAAAGLGVAFVSPLCGEHAAQPNRD